LGKYAGALKNKIDAATRPKDDGSGIIGNPIGRDELLRLLQLEMIPYSPEEFDKHCQQRICVVRCRVVKSFA
jgi:hypothetical protein